MTEMQRIVNDIIWHKDKDHQGNLTATVCGNTVERLSYDAWGRRRNPAGFGYSGVTFTFDRGYTLHEHYDEFGLVNMNGRLYDPVLGRMLSPDIAIQDEHNAQAYNRYSYCFNNPLRFTDPSGFFLKYYYGVEPSTVEYNTDDSEGTQRVNVKWKYDGNEQYTFDAMNKGEGITYHYYTDDPNMNHAINAYQAVKYFDGNKGKTTYDIRMWDPDPNIGGSKPFTRYRLNKIHTLKLKLH